MRSSTSPTNWHAPLSQGGNVAFANEEKFVVMKMSAIEEIGPIEVQEAGRQASGEIAEINTNYKTAHGTI